MASPDQEMDPRYLRGVIDALELIASFIEWKAKNPESDRTEKDFIAKALQKLGTKMEQKLDKVLGVEID